MSAITHTEGQLDALRKRAVETLRKRAVETLRREGRAMHTGELAMLLAVPTYMVHTALHQVQLANIVRLTSTQGWDLVEQRTPLFPPDDGQQQLQA